MSGNRESLNTELCPHKIRAFFNGLKGMCKKKEEIFRETLPYIYIEMRKRVYLCFLRRVAINPIAAAAPASARAPMPALMPVWTFALWLITTV